MSPLSLLPNYKMNVDNFGNTAKIKTTVKLTIKYGKVALKTRRGLILQIAEATYKHKPTGGVINAKTDRKSTRLNSSHVAISYAVFCLKKKIHLLKLFESVNLSKNAGVTISFEGIDLERVKNKQDTVIDVA